MFGLRVALGFVVSAGECFTVGFGFGFVGYALVWYLVCLGFVMPAGWLVDGFWILRVDMLQV